VKDEAIGLIAGGGKLPQLFASAARRQGLRVHAVAHVGETDEGLERFVDSMQWVRVGQAGRIVACLKARSVSRAVMAGSIGRVKSLRQARPDAGMLRIAMGLRTFRDDALLRGIAGYFEQNGVTIVAPTDYVREVLAIEGHLAGPRPTAAQQRDIALGLEVAAALGKADVGQTVVVKEGVVLAVEAVEGTDEAIRRAGKLGGPGAVVVKRTKPGQDLRFDLPAAGPITLEVMREAGAKVLAIEAGKSVILDSEALLTDAQRLQISVLGVRVES
jgi:UDP-2,3-diacylglucosamine hydrolase